ncbi:serine aminopeptidase S33 family [Thermosporothrix hazakensis]|jgi:pimeloyl-ACP methyl ester carboxylesterase|uniref:Serine aminopeptidase S33 family n=2 Tax=Thermosporothrix TaxID=768650 RepID=A0A326UVM3_THEHA|nr:alpha/beta fold hydrolase [Thermosporothrix hazakensis]PZW36543.1 serine aminopeptidase S33 family [Thermosporothrix hazakensis]BBH89010.1 alpha/beta hydrolase [Thermosporothrix sp. COM3]GCE47194.1 alpha/beta hydrolase [Thermosporothrix hazakensis]
MEYQNVDFLSRGDRCAARLYLPNHTQPLPCVILGHGLGATSDMRLDAYATRFATLGLAALVFDYRGFGESAGSPRQIVDIKGQLADWRAAIRYARSNLALDPERIILWGTSFSGGHVLRIAAEDSRIAAVISQIPFTDGLTTLTMYSPLRSLQLLVAALRDYGHHILGREPHYITTVGKVDELAMLATPGAFERYQEMLPAGYRYPNHIAARINLTLPFYRPIQQAQHIRCPVLLCICEQDRITSPQAAIKTARRIPAAEVRTYPGDHIDIYHEPLFSQVLNDQCDFLSRHGLTTA